MIRSLLFLILTNAIQVQAASEELLKPPVQSNNMQKSYTYVVPKKPSPNCMATAYDHIEKCATVCLAGVVVGCGLLRYGKKSPN